MQTWTCCPPLGGWGGCGGGLFTLARKHEDTLPTCIYSCVYHSRLPEMRVWLQLLSCSC